MENTNIGCEACRDLLPLYADGVASGESKALAEAHMADCESCRTELARLQTALPLPPSPPKKAMRTVKQKLRARRILVGVGAGLTAALLLFGLFLFLINYSIPVKTPPEDLQFSVTDGVFTASSQVDSLFTSGMMSSYKAEDGSDIHLVTFSMDNPLICKLWPALAHKVYPPHNDWYNGVLYEYNRAHGMKLVFNLRDSIGRDEDGTLITPDYDLDGKGLWRVYFIQERDYQERHVMEDFAGKLTEESMQYATLVWEETIE